jgi:DNA-binding response OmpR family regulator
VNGKVIDFDNLELHSNGDTVQLTLMEMKLLRYLIEHDGTIVSRKTILEDVWGLQEDTDTRAIDNFIVRLRKYLEDEPNNPQYVRTVRGVGYKFVNDSE